MKMKMALLATVFAASAAALAWAQDNVIEQRQAIMKSNGASAGALNRMVKGDAAFDLTAAKAALTKIAENMTVFPTLFPEGSDKGDTKAGPAIWTDKAGFEAAAAKLAGDAAAAAGSINTLEDLTAAFPAVGGDCGACHSKYRS